MLSYTDRCSCVHRPVFMRTPTDARVYTDRCTTTCKTFSPYLNGLFALLALSLIIFKIGCGSEERVKKVFSFALLSPCTIFHAMQDRLRLGRASKKQVFSFALLSPCTIFHAMQDRLRLGNKNKSKLLFCISLALHYLCIKIANSRVIHKRNPCLLALYYLYI